jgi:hypothetical protein
MHILGGKKEIITRIFFWTKAGGKKLKQEWGIF